MQVAASLLAVAIVVPLLIVALVGGGGALYRCREKHRALHRRAELRGQVVQVRDWGGTVHGVQEACV